MTRARALRLRPWRNQDGDFGASSILVAAALILAGYAAYQVAVKKIPALQAQFGPLAECQRTVKAAIQGIEFNYAKHNDEGKVERDASGNPIFPEGLQLPLDDPSVQAIAGCQTVLENFSKTVKAGNRAAINDLTDQITTALSLAGSCTISTAPSPGHAGEAYSSNVIVNIPFSGGGGANGAISVTGDVTGTGTFVSMKSPQWIGKITIPAAASLPIASSATKTGASQVTVTASTPAVVPKASDGTCHGASIDDGDRCVQIVRGDGTCPPGQTVADGRCLVSCTTAPVTIDWTVQPPQYTLTLSSGGNDFTTDTTVTVGGKVSPAPPAGTLVAIGVNGVVLGTVGVDGAGAYFAQIALPRTTPTSAISITTESRSLTSCGGASAPVVVANHATAADVANVVNAAVVKAGGGADSNTATLTITHVVEIVSDVTVTWTGQCPGPFTNLGGTGRILHAGDFVSMDPGVTCGIPCPGHGTECTASATVSVSTSVGSTFSTGVWDIKIE